MKFFCLKTCCDFFMYSSMYSTGLTGVLCNAGPVWHCCVSLGWTCRTGRSAKQEGWFADVVVVGSVVVVIAIVVVLVLGHADVDVGAVMIGMVLVLVLGLLSLCGEWVASGGGSARCVVVDDVQRGLHHRCQWWWWWWWW